MFCGSDSRPIFAAHCPRISAPLCGRLAEAGFDCRACDERAKKSRPRRARRGPGGDASRGALSHHAGNLPCLGAPNADRSHGHDHRRIRHRQGACRARCMTTTNARKARSSPSTWRQFPAILLRPNCSAAKKGRSRAPISVPPGASSRPREAPSSSMRSATCLAGNCPPGGSQLSSSRMWAWLNSMLQFWERHFPISVSACRRPVRLSPWGKSQDKDFRTALPRNAGRGAFDC